MLSTKKFIIKFINEKKQNMGLCIKMTNFHTVR